MKTLTITRGAPAVTQPTLYRVLHDVELGKPWRQDPEVFWFNRETTKFGADWQRLTFAMNPGMDPLKWRVLYEWDTAFTNGTGFDNPKGPARADFVNNRDLTAALPLWDATRTCGGAAHRGQEDGADLIVDILNGEAPAPSLEWIMARPWYYFEALIVYMDGHVGRFPQNDGRRVLVPLVGSGIARYPLSRLQKWEGSAMPDPYWIP